MNHKKLNIYSVFITKDRMLKFNELWVRNVLAYDDNFTGSDFLIILVFNHI